MSIDWSKAPEGATHWEPSGPSFNEGWMKKEGNEWFYWGEGPKRWFQGKLSCNVSAEREATFEARPQEAWDGQGLPPVGTVCEYRCQDNICEPKDWTVVHVLAHANHGSDTAMLLAEDVSGEPGTMYGRIWIPRTCRPLRTPEQIAAEERRKSILHLANLLIDSRGQCNEYSQAEAIFDAGYRRQEEGK
ncbi:TPA: hypothetical protein L6A81_35310 [Pseudomonas aeruginosa]|uniref:hypothetical protein n=1 Tax=Pseudomonas aeruginosa TaxID=287 RepID=UPI00094721DA|nr:hypothetical protein [Pseudomonas aeruginosa]EKM6409781.1 hypothetical protein [Pseudomonas aeruginosa]ELM3784521.1 hypothetical protein [Pseudomonas aeruginosa]ELM3811444.1 hypothetical protein [Pseudomonas aeruginosa]ELT5290395.1 hypothetical protein [Pseudomonas aeruginosa]MBV5723199.1 hypothetical protein [Pseudomonas aeruginosa]